MSRKSFVSTLSANRSRTRTVIWPGACVADEADKPVAPEERPKIRCKVLGLGQLEQAHFGAVDHFKEIDRKVNPKDDLAFRSRERAETVFLAFETLEGEPIADDVDELAKEPDDIINALYGEWGRFQSEVTIGPLTGEQLDKEIEELKKNIRVDRLLVWPSSWLIALGITLVGRLASSTAADSSGS